MLIKIILIEHNYSISDQSKGSVLRLSIANFFAASKDLLFEEAKIKNVSKEEFDKTYKNVKNFIYTLNNGVYRVIWTLAEKAEKARKEAEATLGGKKKTRRRKKSKRKRKSRRARR